LEFTRRAAIGALFGMTPGFNGSTIMIDLRSRRLIQVEREDLASRWLLPPGSTLKPFSLMALLENGKLRAGEKFYCPRKLEIGGRSFSCSHPLIGAPMDVPAAIAYSCNCFVAHFAQRFEAGELARFLRREGLASASGEIGDASDLDSRRLQAIGEARVLVTPSGLLAGYAGLALHAPELVLAGLEGAVEYGTAQLAAVRGLKVAGKTGTVLTSTGARVAWFAGFAPSRKPEVAIVAVVQGQSGGLDAAPAAGRMLSRHFASVAPASAALRVKLTGDGGVVEMVLDDYVAAVLAGEASVFKSDEALKAMAVAARTYAVRLRGRHSKEGFDFCSTTHCQRADPKGATPRLASIADATSGELLWFEGKPAFACYTRDCGGRSEEAAAVWPDLAEPYLKVHDDAYCGRSGGSAWRWSGASAEIVSALEQSGLRGPRGLREAVVRQTTASGRARTLELVGEGARVPISAGSFRFAVGRVIGWETLRSDRYRVSGLVFEGSGEGHGVGLCQRGADRMGAEGHSYREILGFYYPGTLVGLTGRGLKWVRLGGEFVAVMTTRPGEDAGVVESAERMARALSDQTRLPLPRKIEIRTYPDLDTFRNATGAPGTVAGQTRGSRIDLQPVSVLRNRGVFDSTLRHELLHVLVENRVQPGVSVTERERMVRELERQMR
jgi:stage II sporulation protein D